LLKYIGILLTAVFTGWSVLTETVDRSQRDTRGIVLTGPGVIFVVSLYLSVLLTAASAVFQDKADDRVRFWERKVGNEEVREAFDTEMQKLKPDLEKQGKTLEEQSKSLSEQKISIDSTTKSIKDSGALMNAMVAKTGREVEFANHTFKELNFFLSVEAKGVFESQKAESYTTVGNQLLKYRNDKCVTTELKKPALDEECRPAQDLFNRWAASNELRRYLDPSGRLDLEIEAQFVGFKVDGSMSHCRMPTGEFSDSEECFIFELLPEGTRGARPDLSFSTALVPEISGLNIFFKFAEANGFADAFSDGGIPGRDASFVTLIITGCDKDRTVNSQLAARRANQLRSKANFIVTVNGVDGATSRTISNGYQLVEFKRGLQGTDPCVLSFYATSLKSRAPK
jgi:hypothetical protein